MRRKDREIPNLSGILAILARCGVMRLGLCDGDKPYVVPMHFAVEEGENGITIYFHCAKEGRKIDVLTRNPNACFEADNLLGVVPADSACNWSSQFESVVGEGQIALVADAAEKIRALDAIMAKYGHSGKPAYTATALASVCVLRLAVESVTAKTNLPG